MRTPNSSYCPDQQALDPFSEFLPQFPPAHYLDLQFYPYWPHKYTLKNVDDCSTDGQNVSTGFQALSFQLPGFL